MLSAYGFPFLLAALVSYILTPYIKKLAFLIGAIDRPDNRKVHKKIMPRLGGLAIYIAFMIAAVASLELTKDIVGILLIILNNYSRGDANFQELVSKVDDVKKIYDDVQITYELGEPVTKEVDGMLVIEQNELTHVKITPEQVSAIIAKVNDLRQFIVE